ncbi:MAG: hypothetical protein ACRD82_10205 [Blastocatellia bacterium]
MIILDENIDFFERQKLAKMKIQFRRIGYDIGRYGMKDRNEIIPLLHTLRHPTFFTRDHDFYHPWLRHPGYCLVFVEVNLDEIAKFIRRFLRHPKFRTQAQRLGKVIKVSEIGIHAWHVGAGEAEEVDW